MLKYKDDPKLHTEWMEMSDAQWLKLKSLDLSLKLFGAYRMELRKRDCKTKLAAYVKEKCDLDIDEDALIDIQIKRIHEYKRQLMNILYVIHRYQATMIGLLVGL